jgi:hypothetical protein
LAGSGGEERKGKMTGRGGNRGGGGPARLSRRRRRKERGKGEADRWGHGVSGSRKKKRRGGSVGRCGKLDDGPAGRLGRKVGRVSFSFFLLFFFFKSIFSFQIHTKILLNFSQNFIILLEATQATKNHAKPNNDAQPLVVSILIKLSLIF